MRVSKNLLGVALTCAVMAGTFGFAQQGYAASYVSNYDGLKSSNNYRSNNTTYISNNITMTGNSLPSLSVQNLTIDGNNYSILGNNQNSRWEFAGDPNLTIQNITFSNFKHGELQKKYGYYKGQGLIDLTSSSTGVTLNNVTINGISDNADTANYAVWGGGVTIEQGSSASIIGSTINNVVLSTSYTKDKDGASGAGIFISNGATMTTLSSTTISNNKISSSGNGAYGGGIMNEGSIGTITGTVTENADGTKSYSSTFSGNTAEQTTSGNAYGGAISNGSANDDRGNASITTIENTNFSANTVKTNSGTASGGAIWNKSGATISAINNSVFDSNRAETASGSALGGAIYNAGTITKITDSNFTNNYAATSGGAIYNEGTMTLESTSGKTMTFSGNTVGTNGSGSDIYQTGTTTLTGAGDFVFNGTIAGTGTITKDSKSSGTVTLNGDNSGFTGTYTQNAGITTVGNDGQLFGGTSNILAGTLNYYAKSDLVDTASLIVNSANLVVGDSTNEANLTIKNNSSIDSATSVTVNKAGTLNNAKTSTLAGTVKVNNGGKLANTSSLTLNNTLTNAGKVTNSGTFTTAAAFTNNGTFTNDTAGTTAINSTMTNAGTVDNNGSLTASAEITNSGAINNAGTFTTTADLTNTADGTITNSTAGTFTATNIDNKGSIINNNAMSITSLTNSGTVTNNSNATLEGNITNNAGAKITNSGAISGTTITNAGTLTNNANATITGALTNSGTVTNSGAITGNTTNSGTIDNSNGTITGAITNAGGTITSSATNLIGAVANAGILNLSGGETKGAITNYNNADGTINLSGNLTANHAISGNILNLAGNTVTINANAGSLNLAGLTSNGGKIDAANSSANDTIALGDVTLNGDLNLSIDADLANQTADKITGTNITANGHSIIIDSVNVLSNPTAALPLNLQVADSTLKDAVTLATTINTKITDSNDSTKSYLMSYTTDDNAGYLSFGYGDLYTAVHYNAAQRTYTLNADETEVRNLGTMEGTNAVLNVTGSDSKYSVNGNNYQGVTIGTGNTMNITNVGGYSLNDTQPASGQYVAYTDANGATKYAVINGSWNGFSLALDNHGTLNIENSTFYNNTSKDKRGGAVYNEGTINQINGAFISNTAQGSTGWPAGAAIFNNGQTTDGHVAGTIDKISGIFINNSVTSTGHSYGGAVLNQSVIGTITADFIGNKISVTGTKLPDGSVTEGGAISNEGSITSITGNFINNSATSVLNNSQGGAIHNKTGFGTATIGSIGSTDTQTTFTGNSADIGGAIYNATGATISSITNITFNNNTATTGNGGAIYNAGTMNLTDVIANGNTAGGLGGAIYTSADMTITDSSFGDNDLNYHVINGTKTQNDIYIDGTANVNFVTTNDDTAHDINSGIAGTSTATFTKSGEGALQVNGVNKDFAGTFDITKGNVFFNAAEKTDSFVSGNIKIAQDTSLTADISDDLSQAINNVSGAGTFYKSGKGLLTLNGKNDEFTGTANIHESTLKYVADDANDSYFGGDTILYDTLELDISSNATNQTITNLLSGEEGTGTLIKNGAGAMTIAKTDDFTGTMNVNEGTLNVTAPTTQTTEGEFNFNTNITNAAIYNYIANSSDTYTINSDSAVKFAANSEGTAASGATAGFTNGTYNLKSDLSGAEGNTTSFTSATVNATGTTYAGNYALDSSTLNLADGNVQNVTFNQLSTSGTNQLKLDFSFAGTTTDTEGNTHGGTVDTLTSTNAANGTLTLDSLNAISLDSDNGTTSGSYNVLKNLTWASDGSTEIKSDIYKYTATTTKGGTDLILTATDYVGNTLYILNHERYGDRKFQLVGDSTDYYIGQNLLSTNAGDENSTTAGTLTITGRTDDRKDTIIASTNSTSSDHLSMFVMDNDKTNTTLNITGVTIKNAAAEQGSVINATSSLASAVIKNTTITNNSASSSDDDTYGGAIYNTGKLNVQNSTFSSNSTTGTTRAGGSAIYNTNSAEITTSVFSNNTATATTNSNGGAIYNVGSITKIDGEFDSNAANEGKYSGGGAIFNGINDNSKQGTIDSITGTFKENSASSSQNTYGGAVLNQTKIGTIDADFEGNYINSTGTSEAVAEGGAILNEGSITSITGKFNSNKATSAGNNSQGGAIHNKTGKGTGIIGSIGSTTKQTTFSENRADLGGAIYNAAKATISSITNTQFTGNEATEGSAIYNEGTVTLGETVTFSGNTGNSYIYNTGTMNFTADTTLNNQTTSIIKNDGTINLGTTASAITATIADNIASTSDSTTGTLNITNTTANVTGSVDRQNISIATGSTVNVSVKDKTFNNNAVTISDNSIMNLEDRNITNGSINLDGTGTQLNITHNGNNNMTVSAQLSGSGRVTATGSDTAENTTLTLSGDTNDDSGFTGSLVANSAEKVIFNKTSSNKFFSNEANVTMNDKSEFDYNSTETGTLVLNNSNFANINLNGGSTFALTGAGQGSATYTLENGWVTTDETSNKLIFKSADYVINTNNIVAAKESNKDLITFKNSTVTMGDGVTGSDISDKHTGAKDYTLSGANYALKNSMLDLVETGASRPAGDNYTFDNLTMTDSKLGVDVNLNLELDDKGEVTVAPYADTITTTEGSGIVEITKIFVTGDNGILMNYGDHENSKGAIQIFKQDGATDTNPGLQVAKENNAKVLSWATNVYTYDVKSAKTKYTADSIEVIADGISSTDTLRDLNRNYEQGEGNRGFSFIIDTRNGANTSDYNIYRNLNETEAGNFTVIGLNDEGKTTEGKSILSGVLKDMVIDEKNAERLIDNKDGTYSYDGNKFSADYVEEVTDSEGNTTYTIKKEAFSNTSNGSMFEITKDTDFEMSDVSVQNAKRYSESNEIYTPTGETYKKDGAAIYANNADATIKLTDVDFKNNSVADGNGGAVANVLSKTFTLTKSTITGNSASGDGGAIYNTSSGTTTLSGVTAYANKSGSKGGAIYTSADMTITDSRFGVDSDGKDALNYHKWNGTTAGDTDVQNDIYIDQNAKLTFNATQKESEGGVESLINSGIAGNGNFTKSGAGILNLNGRNKDFTGTFAVASGIVNYTKNDENDSFVTGGVQVAEGTILSLDIEKGLTDNISNVTAYTDKDGNTTSGNINKTGAGTLYLTGGNSGFTGQTNIKEGILAYTASSSSDSYFGGNTVISDSANLTLNIGKAATGQTISKISDDTTGTGTGTITKTGEGDITLTGDNSKFSGETTIENGKLIYSAKQTTDNYFSGNTVINEKGTLETQVSVAAGAKEISKISGTGNFVVNNSTGSDTSGETTYGTTKLTGDNSGFTGTTTIQNGLLSYTKAAGSSYVSGETVFASGTSKLEYTVDSGEDKLGKISSTNDGDGILNKLGAGTLTYNPNSDTNTFSGTANVNAGTLKTTGTKTDDFDFTTVINNAGTLDYTAATGAELTLDKDSKVSFGTNASGATAQFNGGTYNLSNDIQNVSGNNIIIDSATVKTTSTDYSTGNYTIKNSIIDLTNDKTENTTFNYLATDNTELKIDVNLGLPDNAIADTLTATTGGTDIKIALTDLNIFGTTDDGTGSEYTINVLGGKLNFDEDKSLGAISTDVYEYGVKTSDQDLKLTVNKAADDNSLKKMNQYKIDTEEEGKTRAFNFTTNDNPYKIKENLGTTAAGTFTVNGYVDENGNKTVVSGADDSGNDSKSFFETTKDAETDLRINNLTISDAHNEKGGSAVLSNSDNAKVTLNNVDVTSSSSTGNGGAINNTNSKEFSITGGTLSGNTSGGDGGAIYTASDMTITDSNFGTTTLNKDKDGSNDIYIAGSDTNVEFKTNTDSTIASGIAGDGNLNKTGDATLNLSGKNDNFTGNLNITSGDVEFTQKSAADTYIKGTTNISEGTSLTVNNSLSEAIIGEIAGAGDFNKEGSKNAVLSGDNSNFTGNANINEGNLVWNADSTKYISGKTNLGDKGGLVVNTDNGTDLTKINGTGTITKAGSGKLVMTGDNSGFNGNLDVQGGSFGIDTGSVIGSINNATFANGTSINLQNTKAVQDASGNWTTSPSPASIENLYFNNLTLNGNVGLDIDIDLKNNTADKVGAGSVSGGGHLVLGKDSLNVVSDTLLANTNVQIAYGALAKGDNIILDEAAKVVMGPIQKYDVTYSGGNLGFTRQGGTNPDINSVNPSVMASVVATQVGGYLTQVETLHAGFFHMDRYTKYTRNARLAAEHPNTYADSEPTIPAYSNGPIPETSQAMWVKPYTSFEKVNLKGGIGVSNVMYGALYGGDTDLVDLGHGFKGVISAFVGYNGSHQAYNGISMNQQGGTLGLTGTLYKGNFFTGLTVSTGASAGEAYTSYGTDHFSMITAGIANKTGYNLELKEGKVIIQPSLFLGYTFVNTFDYTNSAGVRVDSDPLHAIQVIPGVRVIGNLKHGWQPYAGIDMVWNIMDKTDVMANDVRLPQLSVKPYVQYGVGVQKSWSERFTAFFQTMIRNGGRNGIVLTGGFRWLFGKGGSSNKTSANSAAQRKVIKELKK